MTVARNQQICVEDAYKDVGAKREQDAEAEHLIIILCQDASEGPSYVVKISSQGSLWSIKAPA